MQLTSFVAIVALLIAQSGTLRPRLATRAAGAPAAPTILIHTPDTAPTTSVSTAALTVAGIAADDALVTAVTWTCPQCTVTSGTATGTTSWTFNVTLACAAGAGTSNTITATASDGTLTTPDIITVTCIIPDAGGPTVVIDIPTTNTTDSVTAASYAIGGSCTDDVGCVSVTVTCATCADTSVEADMSGNGDRWNASMVLASGANAMTVTALDAAAQPGTDSITVTLTVDLVWFTNVNLGNFRTTDNTTRTLTATGGTGTITYAEVVDGGDVLNAGDCADITLASTGVLTISTPPVSGVTCSFTVRATDSAGSPDTADREFTLTVSDSAEGSHDYFNAMIALDAAAGANSIVKNWSMRTGQAAINAIDATPSGDNPTWHYEFSGSDCYGGTCDDTSFDGAKFEPPPIDPTGSGAPLRFKPGSAVDMNVAGTKVLWTWDFLYGETFRDVAEDPVPNGFHRKQFSIDTMNNATGTAGYQYGFEVHEQWHDLSTGNGAGSTSIGTTEFHGAGVTLAASGADGYDPHLASGEGGYAIGGGTGPELANIHINYGVVTRFWVLVTARQRLSSSVFDDFRSMRSLGTGKFDIDSCVVSSGTATCTSATQWVGNKTGASAGPRAVAGQTFILHIEGSEASGLNGEWTATVGSSHLQFIITGTGVANGTYTAGTFDPEWSAIHIWMADENREATRIAWGIPIRTTNRYTHFSWRMDTSSTTARAFNPVGWGRNAIVLKNPTLDLTGTCLNDDPTIPIGNTERGNCTIDATNNPTILKKPVR